MKYTRHNSSETQVTLNVSLDKADLNSVKLKTLSRLSDKVKVPGFRPGKAPLSIVEKHIDPNILLSEVATDAVNRFLNEAVKAENIMPLDQPHVALSTYVPHEQLEFKADFEILPPIKLTDYKNLQVKKPSVTVTESNVDQIIEQMRRAMATKHEVDRVAQAGDEVIIDFKGVQNEKAVNGASGKDYPLQIGSNVFIPGFEESIIGKKAGDEFVTTLTFPKEYHVAALAGKDIDFTIKVNKVNELELPPLDDAFAAKNGPFKSMAELREDIKRDASERKEQESLDQFRQDLVEQLVKNSDIPVPEVLVNDQAASQERDFLQNLQYRGSTLKEYLDEQKITEDEWRAKELREQAVYNVQVALALAELRRIENIALTVEELDERWSALLNMYGNNPKIQKDINHPNIRRDFANRLVTEKTIDRLVELNQAPAKK